MRSLPAVIISCAMLDGTASAYAAPVDDIFSPVVGTLWARAEPTFRRGELSGCSLVFAAVEKDFIYKQGAFIAVNGSFGLMSASGNVGITLKVVVEDIDPNTAQFIPSAPAAAYFVSGYETTKDMLVSAGPSDTPGGIFAIFKTDRTLETLLQGIAYDKVSIAFARTVGGTDLQITIETDVVATADDGKRTRSPQTGAKFFECSTALLDKLPK